MRLTVRRTTRLRLTVRRTARLRAVTQDVHAGQEEAMVVSGRVVSPANVSPVVLRLPQVIAVTYLNVPFDEKEAAKAKGARWDTVHKKWFVPPLVDLAPFRRWNLGKKVILRTTYADKEEVRRLGARWDPSINEWYVTDNMDLSNL